jgi:hypothetical protein
VRATIVVTAEPSRRSRQTALGRRRVRTVAVGGLVLAIAAAAVVLTSPSAPRLLPAGHSPSAPARSDRETTVFGFRVDCPRLAIVSPDGEYARADYEMTTPCGSYGNYITLILHRVRGAWVQALVGTGWRCPTNALPARVAIELQLCPGARSSDALAIRPQRPPY